MLTEHSSLPDLDHLRTFLALARLENFSRAGEQIGLSQSGVSRRIRLLEESLGLRLFERIGRRAILTSAGRTLRARLETLMREAETLPRLLRDLAEGARASSDLEHASRRRTRFCRRSWACIVNDIPMSN